MSQELTGEEFGMPGEPDGYVPLERRELFGRVSEFSELMFQKMDSVRVKKGDWRNIPVALLLHRLLEEFTELNKAWFYEGYSATAAEAVDVANIALMIADLTTEAP